MRVVPLSFALTITFSASLSFARFTTGDDQVLFLKNLGLGDRDFGISSSIRIIVMGMGKISFSYGKSFISYSVGRSISPTHYVTIQ